MIFSITTLPLLITMLPITSMALLASIHGGDGLVRNLRHS